MLPQETPREDIIDFKTQIIQKLREMEDRIALIETLSDGSVEIKSDTGDFTTAESWDGRIVLNTSDNNLKIFSESSWRTIITY